jgi:hypothetical protein
VVSLFVACCVLLCYGLDLKSKLVESSADISDIVLRKINTLLRKITLSLLLFLLCYGICICGVVYITLFRVTRGHSQAPSTYLLWVLVLFWIPTLGTGLIFLHIMHFWPVEAGAEAEADATLTSTSTPASSSGTSSHQATTG